MPRLVPLIALTAAVLFIPAPAGGQAHGIRERDYIFWRREHGQGIWPRVGDVRELAPFGHIRRQVTWRMNRDKGLFVEITPLERPVTVYLLVSQPASPEILKPVWAADDLQDTVRFWTDRFWTPAEKCNPTGCPRLRFQALRGKVRIRVLQKRGLTKVTKEK